jgi:Fe-S-cluster containining protein
MASKKHSSSGKAKKASRSNSKSKHKNKPKTTLPTIAVTPENKCNLCVGSICCTYITHQIDTPRSMEEFDYLLWQVSHDNVALFKDEDGWFLSVTGQCAHLGPNGMCAIYDNRPQICRDHSNECCEYDGAAEEDFELYFNSYAALDTYSRKKFKNWDKRFNKWKKKDKQP